MKVLKVIGIILAVIVAIGILYLGMFVHISILDWRIEKYMTEQSNGGK